jgi:5-methylcytosine-specific restriction protein A
MQLIAHQLYSRKTLWNLLFQDEDYPLGGDWFTGYTSKNGIFFIFANIGNAGRTGDDYPNKIHPNGNLEWYGKPNAHSAQNNLQLLLDGKLVPRIFVRYDSTDTDFYYFGEVSIENFSDNKSVTMGTGKDTKVLHTININFIPKVNGIPGKTTYVDESDFISEEGGKALILTNRYERDPQLRQKAIDIHGTKCNACGFDFMQVYGELGYGYCQIHHIKPLSEIGKKTYINPKTDLVPLCANCHAMVHRVKPALSIDKLKVILDTK